MQQELSSVSVFKTDVDETMKVARPPLKQYGRPKPRYQYPPLRK